MKNKDRIRKPVRCTTCNQLFHRREAICWRCGCCQFCGELNNSKFRTSCHHCGQFINQPPYDKSGQMVMVHHHPH